MQSIENQIEKSIKSRSKGILIIPKDYVNYGSSVAIRKALDRLEKKQVIIQQFNGTISAKHLPYMRY